MKVLFAVSNEEISESIVKKYQREYKEIISYKNVYYFNAILKELQKDKTYDRVVISEDLEAFTNAQYEQIDKFIFEKLDSISDEASNTRGNDIPIILICSDRRTKSEELLVKLFGIGIYDALIGNDRSIDEVCNLIHRPRLKKEAKIYYKIDSDEVGYQAENENDVSEMEIQNIVAHYKRLGRNEDKFVESFDNIAAQYNDVQLRIITKFLPINVRAVLEERCPKYQQVMSFNSSVSDSLRYQGNKKSEPQGPTETLLKQTSKERVITEPIVIPSSVNMQGGVKLSRQKTNMNQNVEEPMTQSMQQPVQQPMMQNMQRPAQEQNHNSMYMGNKPVERQEEQQPISSSTMEPRREENINSVQDNYINQNVQQEKEEPEVEPIVDFYEEEPKTQFEPVQNEVPENPVMEPIQTEPVVQEVPEIPETSGTKEQQKTEQSLDDLFEDLQSIDNELSKQEVENTETNNTTEDNTIEPVKRGRGRPRKYPVSSEGELPKIKRGRGRPRKYPVAGENALQDDINGTSEFDDKFDDIIPNFDEPMQDNNDDLDLLPSFDEPEENSDDDYNMLPSFDDDEKTEESNDYGVLPGFEEDEPKQDNNDYGVLPGFEEDEPKQDNNDYGTLPGFEDNEPEKREEHEDDYFNTLPGMEDDEVESSQNNYSNYNNSYDNQNTVNNSEEYIVQPEQDSYNNYNNQNNYNNNTLDNQDNYNNTVNNYDNYNVSNNYNSYEDDNNYESTIDLSSLLTPDKKIVSFVGTSKNGTSFIVNNLAEYMSTQMGINTVILDTTKNRNSYYIYTKNEEQLRTTAAHSIQGLTRGITQGINVNKNLTVYTALPDENETIKNVDEILETLLKNYSLILIDADFDTPVGYFKQSQETYLVQTLDILTIQPLTAFLRDLKAKNILDENKLRVILNKTVGIKGITEKTIIGGMAYYNDPAMSFMTELFDRNSVKYMTIPFEQEIYTKYLQGIIECEITLKGYSKTFIQNLKMLANMVYSASPNNTYAPPSIGNMNTNMNQNMGGQGFSSMNSTLDQMRRNY